MSSDLGPSRGITFERAAVCDTIHGERDKVALFAAGRQPEPKLTTYAHLRIDGRRSCHARPSRHTLVTAPNAIVRASLHLTRRV